MQTKFFSFKTVLSRGENGSSYLQWQCNGFDPSNSARQRSHRCPGKQASLQHCIRCCSASEFKKLSWNVPQSYRTRLYTLQSELLLAPELWPDQGKAELATCILLAANRKEGTDPLLSHHSYLWRWYVHKEAVNTRALYGEDSGLPPSLPRGVHLTSSSSLYCSEQWGKTTNMVLFPSLSGLGSTETSQRKNHHQICTAREDNTWTTLHFALPSSLSRIIVFFFNSIIV